MTRMRPHQRVYFIKPIGMDGPIKIGCSQSPDGRRVTLATWSPFPLELIAETSGGFEIERQFHTLFGDDHIGREWFAASPRLMQVIAEIQAGTFDLATLPRPERINRMRSARDKSYLTPEFRYRMSVRTRLRHAAGSWPRYTELHDRLCGIFGESHYRVPAQAFADNRDKLEALIAVVRTERAA